MIGSELAPHYEYLLARAADELQVRRPAQPLAKRIAPAFIRLFGVPEIGVQIRIMTVLRKIPASVRSIVDVGCGAGMLLGAIHGKDPGVTLTGIEIDGRSAALARRSHPYATVVTGDAVEQSCALQGAFDCAISIDVLEHVPDAQLAPFAAAMVGMVRPGGLLIVHVPFLVQRRHLKRFASWGHHDHEREGFTAEDLTTLFANAGADVVATGGTMGFLASLAWEINMLVAAKPLQAVVFPLALAGAMLGERLPSRHHNGLVLVARRRAAGA